MENQIPAKLTFFAPPFCAEIGLLCALYGGIKFSDSLSRGKLLQFFNHAFNRTDMDYKSCLKISQLITYHTKGDCLDDLQGKPGAEFVFRFCNLSCKAEDWMTRNNLQELFRNWVQA